MRPDSRRVRLSYRQSSTRVAFSEYSAKLTPVPSQVAPNGCGLPGRTILSIPPLLQLQTLHLDAGKLQLLVIPQTRHHSATKGHRGKTKCGKTKLSSRKSPAPHLIVRGRYRHAGQMCES